MVASPLRAYGSPEMLAVSRRHNPECEHVEGDMRSVRLGRTFDCVFVPDAIVYALTLDDLLAVEHGSWSSSEPCKVTRGGPGPPGGHRRLAEAFFPTGAKGSTTRGAEGGDYALRDLLAKPRMTRRCGLVLATALLASCVQGGTSRFGPRMNCAWRVCLTHVDRPSGRVYQVENREPVPVTVGLDFRQLENLRSPPENPVRWVIPPFSSEAITVASVRRGQAVSADVAMSVDLGASSTEADDFVYGVPFGGTSPHPLIQGYGGAETHIASMRYSLDFGMPQGTPVVAARDGVVLYVQDGFREGGADPRLLERANLVVVAHGDGTMASYGHLQRGLEVAVGDEVVQGQLLGRSGRTGFAGQPHLHFHVGLRMLGEPGRTIPISMRAGDGRVLELTTGMMIPAAPDRT